MTSLDFLYIALGAGFILFAIFGSVLMVFLILILRDISKISKEATEVAVNIKESSQKITEYVIEPIKLVDNFLSNFGFIREAFERVKEEVIKRTHGEDENTEESSSSKNRKKNGFSVKKMK